MNREQSSAHIFLGRAELDGTIDMIDALVESINEIPYDTNRFTSFTVEPNQIDENTLYQLADIFDKKTHMNDEDLSVSQYTGPNTVDKILDAIAVIYIEENGVPVAAAILADPTKEDYNGIIPSDYYEMKSGTSVENRMEQEYFDVLPDKRGLGLATELRKQIDALAPNTFIIVPDNDTDTMNGLEVNGYTHVATFEIDGEVYPVQMWVNNI